MYKVLTPRGPTLAEIVYEISYMFSVTVDRKITYHIIVIHKYEISLLSIIL